MQRRLNSMTQNPLITIVIPVFNREKVVRRTLDSVAAQTFRPLNVILVDNGSVDGTLQLLNEWKDSVECDGFNVKVLEEPSAGACLARNRGLREVSTPYVMFFDSDDVMSPAHVDRAASVIMKNPDADVVGWDADCVSLSGKRRKLIFASENFLFNHIFHASLSTQRYICRTEFIRSAGGWNESVFGWNDYELGMRLLLRNPKIVYAGRERTVTVYSQEESITGTGFSMSQTKWEHSLDVCQMQLENAGLGRAVKWIETRRVILAGHYRKEGDDGAGERLVNEVLSRAVRLRDRMFYKMVYMFVACGGRGVAIMAKLMI